MIMRVRFKVRFWCVFDTGAFLVHSEMEVYMNRIVKILMRRDGLTEAEALEVVQDARSEVEFLISQGWYEDAEDVIVYELGLEVDYAIYLLA